MPKTCKKKSYKKKANKGSWLTVYKPRARTVYPPNVGIGRSLFTKLRTSFFANVTAAAGTGIFTGYLNPGSCFDPCGDLAALQPAGYDQLAALYARYLVTGCDVKIEIMPVTTTNTTNTWPNFHAAAYPSTVSTALATFQGAASQPYSQNGSCQHGGNNIKFRFRLNTQQIVGARLPVIAEDCGALVGASPTTGQNIIIPMFIQSATVGAQVFTVRCTIIQDVIFDQRVQVVDA